MHCNGDTDIFLLAGFQQEVCWLAHRSLQLPSTVQKRLLLPAEPRKVAGAMLRERPCWLQQACCGLPAGHGWTADAAPGVHSAILQHPDCLPGEHSQCGTQKNGSWPQHD